MTHVNSSNETFYGNIQSANLVFDPATSITSIQMTWQTPLPNYRGAVADQWCSHLLDWLFQYGLSVYFHPIWHSDLVKDTRVLALYIFLD